MSGRAARPQRRVRGEAGPGYPAHYTPESLLRDPSRMVRVGQLDECAIARVDLLPAQIGQAIERETFNHERSHYTAIDHRRAQHRLGDLAVPRDVAHETAGTGVAGPGRIDHFLKR